MENMQDLVGYEAEVVTSFMTFNTSCLQLHFRFLGRQISQLTVTILGADSRPVQAQTVQGSWQGRTPTNLWETFTMSLPDGIHKVRWQGST